MNISLNYCIVSAAFAAVALSPITQAQQESPTAQEESSAESLFKQGLRLRADLIRTLQWDENTSAEAVRLIRSAAEQGLAAAQYEYALMLMRGDGMREQDLKSAAQWCHKAAEQGNREAQFAMSALCPFLSDAGKASDDEQLRWQKTAALAGLPAAQYQMGCYYDDQGDKSQAVEWYRKAAEQGIAEAQVELALALLNGDQVEPQNAQEAVRLLRVAAEQGCEAAYMLLADCLEKGVGVEKNLKEAVKWLVEAAKLRRDLEALDKLSKLAPSAYSQEERDACRAAADQGDVDALFRLACMIKPAYPRKKVINICWGASASDVHASGLKGGVSFKGDEEAAALFAQAAAQGHKEAQRFYGLCCEFGDGCEESMDEAVRWERLAAEQGDAEAQYILASYYFAGRGVEQDIQQAVHWFRKAAENGYALAQANMGYFCSEDIGETKANPDEALEWFRKAAEQGDAQSIEEYERRTGEPWQKK